MNTLNSFVAYFTDEKVGDVLQIGKSFFKVDSEQKELIKQIKASCGKDPRYAGIFLGEKKGTRFEPSIALLDIIGKTSSRKIVVDDKMEWLFLCGRDIFGKSIVKAQVSEGFVLVTNQNDEVLGWGKITDDLSKKNKAVVKNKLDRGDFLRRER